MPVVDLKFRVPEIPSRYIIETWLIKVQSEISDPRKHFHAPDIL